MFVVVSFRSRLCCIVCLLFGLFVLGSYNGIVRPVRSIVIVLFRGVCPTGSLMLVVLTSGLSLRCVYHVIGKLRVCLMVMPPCRGLSCLVG